ncbi:bacteriodes thetaiotaomicron symbiotic chitinase [Penicillium pulvis]|uniref:bacteriodes thetaiotaomicron symbiotic chitinase n=1 Tax=Penicillium pulvis TaxID=1562058 RepID=UPI002546AE85|nr:bacteriodes thetaiotaomicron symbiotic chitinase [Penicillium pulvis]KAJ5797783.1 bacteriodes thetaiotaomicron symbiotic chitinase [Penicillium pulvis]
MAPRRNFQPTGPYPLPHWIFLIASLSTSRRSYGCTVTFKPQTTLFKRAQDPEAKAGVGVDVTDENLNNPIALFTEDGKGYLDHAARDLEGMMEELKLETDEEK